mmetsp:Transcript_49845/g.116288  ORF Transcript_49845/g.116288 Transcript_49845/m.116288 type:complete len:209 (+) Transcript_49845:1562-2188(+)
MHRLPLLLPLPPQRHRLPSGGRRSKLAQELETQKPQALLSAALSNPQSFWPPNPQGMLTRSHTDPALLVVQQHLGALDNPSSNAQQYHKCGKHEILDLLLRVPLGENTSNLLVCMQGPAGTCPWRDHHPPPCPEDARRNIPVACTSDQICKWYCWDPHRSHARWDGYPCTANSCKPAHICTGSRLCLPKGIACLLCLRAAHSLPWSPD